VPNQNKNISKSKKKSVCMGAESKQRPIKKEKALRPRPKGAGDTHRCMRERWPGKNQHRKSQTQTKQKQAKERKKNRPSFRKRKKKSKNPKKKKKKKKRRNIYKRCFCRSFPCFSVIFVAY
jgi:hypothetical protein